MQVPATPAAAAPVVPAAAAQSSPAEAPVAAAFPAAAATGSDTPIVQIGDDEHWRKSVSRKKPAARRSSSSPAWRWPVVAVAVIGVAAAGLFVWKNGQQGDVAVDPDPQPVEVAQSSTEEATASTAAGDSATTTDDSKPEIANGNAVAEGSEDSTPTTTPTDAEPTTLANASPSASDGAMAPSSASTEGETTSAETTSPGTATSDSASNAESTPKIAAGDSTEPVELKGPPEDVLKEHGIRIVGEQATLIDEARPQITAALTEARKLRLSLTKSYADAMKLERLQKDLKAEYGTRSAALAQVNATGGSVQANNLLVGQLSAIQTKLEQVEDEVETSRARLAAAREAYIEHLLKTREIVKGVETKYADAAANPQVKAALAKLSTGENELTLEPLGSFYRVQKELETLESQVLSDTIVARVQSGNLFVSTQINGDHTIEMIVDSGASVVTLPYQMAVDAGLKPKDTDPTAQFRIANGALITGKMITIPSLRVGKFTVENVEAAVLGPEAVEAEPLLGMSFLSKFEMKIDSERGHLVLSRIEGTEGSDRIR